MKYEITYHNLHIEDSYKASKSEMISFLEKTRASHSWSDIWNRSLGSMKREWATHNLLYNLHMLRSHTKDVDINYPQKWYVKIVYAVFGTISLLFIK